MKPGGSFYLEARERFRKRVTGVAPKTLADIVLKGSNQGVWWWRAMLIRQAWRDMCKAIARKEDQLSLLARYCPGVELSEG